MTTNRIVTNLKKKRYEMIWAFWAFLERHWMNDETSTSKRKKNATRFGKVLKFIIKIFRLFSPLGQLSTTYDVHTCWGQILGFFEFCYTFKVSELTLNLDLIFVVLICRKFLGAAEKRRGCTDGGAVKGYKVLIFIVLILFWKVSNNEKQHFFLGRFCGFYQTARTDKDVTEMTDTKLGKH